VLFFELIQVALGQKESLTKNPSEQEWKAMLDMAKKQAVVGITFLALSKLAEIGQKPPLPLLYEWIGLSVQIRCDNQLAQNRCQELEKILDDGGFKNCVLKGQGMALYYKYPDSRQHGDIDVWVDGERDEVLAFIKDKGYCIGHVDIKHSDVSFFEDVPVEVHFLPSWMYSHSKNRILQQFFREKADSQFRNYDESAGFTHTTVEFDLVYSLVHIYRHVFDDGIGLRQLLDYYNILLHSTLEQRKDALGIVNQLGMKKFAGGVMYVLKESFLLKSDYYLCELNSSHGKHLLDEILLAGNFGQFDKRYSHRVKGDRLVNGITNIKRNFKFLFYYPSEVLCSPIWKVWHWCWRKKKGYL
jgi:hypothetical protein